MAFKAIHAPKTYIDDSAASTSVSTAATPSKTYVPYDPELGQMPKNNDKADNKGKKKDKRRPPPILSPPYVETRESNPFYGNRHLEGIAATPISSTQIDASVADRV